MVHIYEYKNKHVHKNCIYGLYTYNTNILHRCTHIQRHAHIHTYKTHITKLSVVHANVLKATYI